MQMLHLHHDSKQRSKKKLQNHWHGANAVTWYIVMHWCNAEIHRIFSSSFWFSNTMHFHNLFNVSFVNNDNTEHIHQPSMLWTVTFDFDSLWNNNQTDKQQKTKYTAFGCFWYVFAKMCIVQFYSTSHHPYNL